MQSSSPYASVIILTRNGLPLLKRCLEMVFAQVTSWPYEVIVIDSQSTDGTWDFLASYPVIRTRIVPQEFNHGATRNLGARLARGEFVVFLVQDAIPYNGLWLQNLVTACEATSVAGSYSRQNTRPESTLITHYLTSNTIPSSEHREVKMLKAGIRLIDLPSWNQFALSLFQNASSCLRKNVWSEYPFAKLPYGEDIEWGKRVIEAGYALVYEPTSTVYHSHDRSAAYALKRAYADHYQAAELFNLVMVPSLPRLLKLAMSDIGRGWRYLAHMPAAPILKWRALVELPLFLIANGVGQYLGSHLYYWLPRRKWLNALDRRFRVGV